MHTVHLTATLSGEFSLVGVCWVVSSGCAVSSTIKKKIGAVFQFPVHGADRRRVCGGGGVWGGG